MLNDTILELVNSHPIFQLATCEGEFPHVRHMMLYKADESGFIFHTGFEKDICQQIMENNNVEMCFFDLDSFLQIRISGKAIIIHDKDLREEILAHPTREYLRMLRSMNQFKDFDENFVIFKVIDCKASLWTIQQNYDKIKKYEKYYIDLSD